MARIKSFELYSVDIPFRRPFRHAAADRVSSSSMFLKCVLESGRFGFGESLPRDYVTGETRDHSFDLLRNRILPRLLGKEFHSLDHLVSFLKDCDGKSPGNWVSPELPQTAAWAAVDLALLDALGHELQLPVRLGNSSIEPPDFRYSAVFSDQKGISAIWTLLKIRFYGFRHVKIKIDRSTAEKSIRLARRILGARRDIRVDANMTWDIHHALQAMKSLSRLGVRSFEQPLGANDIEGASKLVTGTGLDVMADESLTDSDSLERLIKNRACTSVNIRISKCGGLVASRNRISRALDAGLKVQQGCQVGETSLLSAAQLILIAALGPGCYAEGCFGLHLLREDPVRPLMQFGWGGRPP